MFGDAGVLTVRFRLWAEILQNIGGKSNAGVSVQITAAGWKTGAVFPGDGSAMNYFLEISIKK